MNRSKVKKQAQPLNSIANKSARTGIKAKVTRKASSSEERLETRLQQLEQLVLAQNAQMNQLQQELTQARQVTKAVPPANSNSIDHSNSKTTSRRRLLKGLGLAATAASLGTASAAGLTLLTQSTAAQAASGDIVLLGNSNLASNSTYLTQTSGTTSLDKAAVLVAEYNPTGAVTLDNTLKIGLAGVSNGGPGIGGYFQGDRAPILLQPGASSNRTGGTHSRGELYAQDDGTNASSLWYYGGSGNGWLQLGGTGSGAGVASGPTFPSSPTPNQLFFNTNSSNTNTNKLFYWNGNVWLTVQQYRTAMRASSGNIIISNTDFVLGDYQDGSCYVEQLHLLFVLQAQSSMNYWSWSVIGTTLGSVPPITNSSTLTTAGLTHVVNTYGSGNPTNFANGLPEVYFVATGSPGAMVLYACELLFRLVGV